jgi:hypothetical protein
VGLEQVWTALVLSYFAAQLPRKEGRFMPKLEPSQFRHTPAASLTFGASQYLHGPLALKATCSSEPAEATGDSPSCGLSWYTADTIPVLPRILEKITGVVFGRRISLQWEWCNSFHLPAIRCQSHTGRDIVLSIPKARIIRSLRVGVGWGEQVHTTFESCELI